VTGPETRIATERSYAGRTFDLQVDRVRLPDGREALREVVVHPGSVVLVPVDGEDVLLVRQFRYAVGTHLLELPAGTLDPGEERAAAALRELREETGYSARSLEPLATAFPSPGYTSEAMHFYLATDLFPAPLSADDDEQIELERIPLNDAVSAARSGSYTDLKTLTGILLAAERLQR
jgi:ADP-ribose pyrophosphatase